MKSPIIYLDYAATTPVDPRVALKMHACLLSDGQFGNPASQHTYGLAAREMVELARQQVAAFLYADPTEILWTSGATESNNLAIKGAASMYQRKGKHIITLKTEHKAVLDPCQYLEKEGYTVTYLLPKKNGLIDLEEFQQAMRPETILASVMYVNNETGIIQPIPEIAVLTSARGVLLHVDAAQAPGKIAINLAQTPVDLLSLSAHKAYGPKGIGALYVRKKPRVRLQPLIHGGGHEQGMRSGTLPTHQIAGMGEALMLAELERAGDTDRIRELRDRFLQGLQGIPNLQLNTDLSHSVPQILNLRFTGMLADAILAKLPTIATSTASACQGKGTEGSYVLRVMGLSDSEVKSSLRFSFGRFTTPLEIDSAVQAINEIFIS